LFFIPVLVASKCLQILIVFFASVCLYRLPTTLLSSILSYPFAL
jgi:hypothetical protein